MTINRQPWTRQPRRASAPPSSLRKFLEQLEERALLATVCNFDDPCSSFTLTRHQNLPAAEVRSEGQNQFLTLADHPTGSFPVHNTINFVRTDSGSFDQVVIEFDFRMTPVFGRADGFGVALLNMADAEYSSSQRVGGSSEEPNFRRSIGFGIDNHRGSGELNNNHVSVHWDGQKFAEFDASPVDLAGGNWIRARIVLRPGGGFSDVSVTLTPQGGQPVTVVDSYAVAGFVPYEGRLHFGGRNGGQSSRQDLDNVIVEFSNFPVAHPGVAELTTSVVTTEESTPSVTLTVVRSGGTDGSLSVQYFAEGQTAIAGTDFDAVSGTVTFAAGDASPKNIAITIRDDSVGEPTERLGFRLANPVGGGLGSVTTAEVVVVDDDNPKGSWSDVINWPIVAVHTTLLPTGKVMSWPHHGADGEPYLWDPATGLFTRAPSPGYDIFCSGHALLPDGRVFVAGGHVSDGVGLEKASIYDPFTNTWEPLPDMNAGRWYATVTVLPNGDVLVMGGTIRPGVVNRVSQVFEFATRTWRDLTSAQLGDPPMWAEYYPFNYVAPDGRVVVAGPQQTSRYLDTTGTGSWADIAPSSVSYRDYGSSVMFDPGKVLIVGGNPRDPSVLPSASAEVIDLNSANPMWHVVQPMTFPRRHLDATLDPSGQVFVSGGTSSPGFNDSRGAVNVAELFDPRTEQWFTLARSQVPRMYHHTTILLPDGRFLTAGGGEPPAEGDVDHPNAEIFSPPYLDGQRPIINTVPSQINYNERFFVGTSSVIADVTGVRLSSVTHSFNESQQFIRMPFEQVAGGVQVTAPASPNLAPAGDWMLFLMNDQGVPAVAPIVRLSSDAPIDRTPPVAQIVPVTPDPRATAVEAIDIVLNERVTGFGPEDLRVTRNGSEILLTPAQTLTSTDGEHWRLANLAGLTSVPGPYSITLVSTASGITDEAGNALAADASDQWTTTAPAPTVRILSVRSTRRGDQVVISGRIEGPRPAGRLLAASAVYPEGNIFYTQPTRKVSRSGNFTLIAFIGRPRRDYGISFSISAYVYTQENRQRVPVFGPTNPVASEAEFRAALDPFVISLSEPILHVKERR